jgi:hypothetical protein
MNINSKQRYLHIVSQILVKINQCYRSLDEDTLIRMQYDVRALNNMIDSDLSILRDNHGYEDDLGVDNGGGGGGGEDEFDDPTRPYAKAKDPRVHLSHFNSKKFEAEHDFDWETNEYVPKNTKPPTKPPTFQVIKK